jgi:hypothetical protein
MSGHLLSPLDAGPTERWFVERTILISEAQRCGGAVVGTGEVLCADRFEVESITEVAR